MNAGYLLPRVAAGLALVATTAYAVFAGADFGGGLWDVFLRGPRADEERDAIAHAMGPVWEANHVWLIFLLVVLFTAFPPAYAALGVSLFVPFHLVLAGVIFRGAAFVFRGHAPRGGAVGRALGIAFGAASIGTPFVLGACVASISDGAPGDLPSPDDPIGSWTSPFAIVAGLLAVAICAFLAATYLTVETEGESRDSYRKKALGAWGVVALLSAVLLPLATSEASHLASGLASGPGKFVVAAGGLAALGAAFALWKRWYKLARVAAAGEVALLLFGWAIGQHPYVIYPVFTIEGAAAPRSTLMFVAISTPIGAAVLVPSLIFLFSVFKRQAPVPSAEK